MIYFSYLLFFIGGWIITTNMLFLFKSITKANEKSGSLTHLFGGGFIFIGLFIYNQMFFSSTLFLSLFLDITYFYPFFILLAFLRKDNSDCY
jgi:hypothetical protein